MKLTTSGKGTDDREEERLTVMKQLGIDGKGLSVLKHLL